MTGEELPSSKLDEPSGLVKFESGEVEGLYALARLAQALFTKDFFKAASPDIADPDFQAAFGEIVKKLDGARFGERKQAATEAQAVEQAEKISAYVRTLL